jgi:hypothetical protein
VMTGRKHPLDGPALLKKDDQLMTFGSNVLFMRARAKYRIYSSVKVVCICV